MLSVSDAFKTAAAATTRRVLAKVECYFDGINAVDISAYVKRFEIVRERFYGQEGTIPLGNYSAGQITIELDNTDKRFSPYNTEGPYYGYLIPNRKIVVQLGFVTGSGDEYCGAGEFYSVKWGAGQEATARLVARDRAMLLQRQEYEEAVQENKTISELVEMICDGVGITSEQRRSSETTISIPYAPFCPETVWENLRQLAIGEGGYIYFDEEGKLVFESRGYLAQQTESLMTLDDDSHIVTLNHEVDQQRIRNRVRVGRKLFSEAAEKTIWSLDETLSVPGTSAWWNTNWGKRRPVTITAASGSDNDLTTEHTIKLTITGAAASGIYSNSRSDQNDVRIVYRESPGVYHDLDRYIHQFTSSEIIIYFRIYTLISAGNSDEDYAVYYDNASAGSPSEDWANVFRFGDRFNRESLGSAWANPGEFSIVDSTLKLGGIALPKACIYNTSDDSTHVEIRAKMRYSNIESVNAERGLYAHTSKDTGETKGGFSKVKEGGTVDPGIRTGSGTSWGTNFSFDLTDWHVLKLVKKGSSWKLYFDDVERASRTETLTLDWFGVFGGSGGSMNVYWDDWWVRWITENDPTIVIGSAETPPPDAGYNILAIKIQFEGPAVDIQAPVITSGGPDLSVHSYTYYSCGGEIVIKNVGETQNIDGLTVDGKLLEESDAIFTEAVDQDSIDEHGEQAYALENTFIQTSEQAQGMADGLLAEYLNPGRQVTVQMPNRAQPHLQLGDRLTVQNDATGIDGDYHAVRHRMVYDGGLSGELTCLEAS